MDVKVFPRKYQISISEEEMLNLVKPYIAARLNEAKAITFAYHDDESSTFVFTGVEHE